MPATPFTDPDQLAPLYATAERLARRTGALHAAKISGVDATTTIVDLAARTTPPEAVVADIGCGRGTTTLALAAHLAPGRLIAVDRSSALLQTVLNRAAQAGPHVTTVCADFHHLPLLDAGLDLAVAAFCLYHSIQPELVVAELARVLTPTGTAILVTKSIDSYREIDHLVARAGLDPDAADRPSLYGSFHTDNAAAITATGMRVAYVVHQQHVFRYADLDHLATYLGTSPKYQLNDHLAGDPVALAAALLRRLPDEPLTATSTITYIVATPT
jgi:SAM-dependent methyltransferase